MLLRKLHPVAVHFGKTASITLSKKISSAVAAVTAELCVKAAAEIDTHPAPAELLEEIHQALDAATELVRTASTTAKELELAASVLEGNPVVSRSPLVEFALEVRALGDTIALASPELENLALPETIKSLKDASQALHEDAEIANRRLVKADMFARSATLRALIRPNVDPIELLASYEVPEWAGNLEPDELPGEPKRIVLENGTLVSRGLSLTERRALGIKNRAKQLLAEEAARLRKQKSDRRAKERTDLSRKVQQVWARHG